MLGSWQTAVGCCRAGGTDGRLVIGNWASRLGGAGWHRSHRKAPSDRFETSLTGPIGCQVLGRRSSSSGDKGDPVGSAPPRMSALIMCCSRSQIGEGRSCNNCHSSSRPPPAPAGSSLRGVMHDDGNWDSRCEGRVDIIEPMPDSQVPPTSLEPWLPERATDRFHAPAPPDSPEVTTYQSEETSFWRRLPMLTTSSATKPTRR